MARVIAVSAPIGGGKSSLSAALCQVLGAASVVAFDSYERMTERPISAIRQWLSAGAPLAEVPIPGLAADLTALREGRSVRDPLSGAMVQPAPFLLLDSQFGREHPELRALVDFQVWIDVPADLALARKLRQYAATMGQEAGFAAWLDGYLENYQQVVRALLERQRETVGAHADLVVDGTLPPQVLAEQVALVLKQSFSTP